jgi:hypothetical protein
MRDLKLAQLFRWRLKSSGMLHFVTSRQSAPFRRIVVEGVYVPSKRRWLFTSKHGVTLQKILFSSSLIQICNFTATPTCPVNVLALIFNDALVAAEGV